MKRKIAALTTAVATVAAMAALAAPAGAQTVVCNEFATPCPASQIQPAGSYVITGDTAGFPGIQFNASGLIEIECSQNTMEAESKATIGNPLAAEFDGTLSGCVHLGNGKLPCTGSMNKPPTTMEGTATGGLMKIGTAAEPLTFTFECGTAPSTYKCVYKMKETLNLDVQGEEAKALFKSMYLAEGAGCSGSSPNLSVRNQSWYGDYISTYSPTGSVVCKTSEEPCDNEANWYGAGTALEAEPKAGTKTKFTNPIYTTECSSSPLVGKLTGSGGKGTAVPVEITSASFTGCSNSTTVTVENLPWKGSLSYSTTSGSGTLFTSAATFKFLRFGITCRYGALANFKVLNNSELVLTSATMTVLTGSSGLCGSAGSPTGTWSGSYNLTAPSPFFLTWI